MGIRIHKCIGYGLVDVVENDSRINPIGYLGGDVGWEEKEDIWTKEGFLRYYKNHSRIPIYSDFIRRYFQPYNSVIRDDEFGCDNVLLICPSWFRDWNRYDDIIDYVENGGRIDNTWKILNGGIYPYSGAYTDLRTYKDASRFASEFWYNLNSIETSSKYNDVHRNLAEHHAKEMGFDSVDEAVTNIIPKVPDVIVMLCDWLNLFSNPITALELKPILYVYWG